FVGTFTAGGLQVAIENGQIRIVQEGKVRKFVEQVEHTTFSGAYAVSKNQPALYVTERCVFKLTPDGMTLTEVAPGIDVERDILAQMDFEPVIPGTPKTMDARIFEEKVMGLKDDLLEIPLEDRFIYDPKEDLFFVNLENFAVKTSEQVRRVEAAVEDILRPLDRKVHAIVNYDNFSIAPEVLNEYTYMVKGLVDRFYSRVTRYTTSTFLRMKLGDALQARNVAPHIYESSSEARKALGRE
ncbi:MAG: acyl CoA:acetate/3-ketoacid CoA transferase, partial [Desulfococcaceae bacterium]